MNYEKQYKNVFGHAVPLPRHQSSCLRYALHTPMGSTWASEWTVVSSALSSALLVKLEAVWHVVVGELCRAWFLYSSEVADNPLTPP